MIRTLFLSTALVAGLAAPLAAQEAADSTEATPAEPAATTPLNPEATPAEGDAQGDAATGADADEAGAGDTNADAGDEGGDSDAASADKPRVGLTSSMAEASFTTPQGEEVTISREQAPGATLEGDWALIGRDCPPFCIQPMTPAPGVETVGELELIEAMKGGDVTLVDGRTPDWYISGTIPGAINIPFTQSIERLGELGCEPDFDGKFDCTDANEAILFCNGPWCGQSPTAIREMVDAGYPAERIRYYRGGMQEWRMLGLTVAGGTQPAATDPVAEQEVTPDDAAEPGAGQEKAAADAETDAGAENAAE